MEQGKTVLITDAFRSELFKSGLFQIQDKAWEPGSKATGLDKGASGSVELFGKTWIVSLKVTDMATGTLDFSETVHVTSEDLLFQASKELVAQLSNRFRFGVLSSRPQSAEEQAKTWEAQWSSLGATGTVLSELVALQAGTEDFLSFRQYDGNITAQEYLELKKKSVDLQVLKMFLQSGISYKDAKRALALGINRLEKYQLSFQPAHFEFGEYLDAYALGFSTAAEYSKYLAGSERDFVALGLGGVANALPVGTADFRFLAGQLGWEHSWTKNPRDWYRLNTEAGFLLLNILPVPYAGVYLLAGSQPFFAKVGVGGLAEMLVGNHVALHLRLGLEVASQFEVTLIDVPIGTQPVVNYVTGQKWDSRVEGPIKFPYFGMIFTYKIPLGRKP